MDEFLSFRRMVTPVVIQVVFWLGLVANLVVSIVTMTRGGLNILFGLLLIFIGSLMVRVYCELIILFFRIYDSVRAIENSRKAA